MEQIRNLMTLDQWEEAYASSQDRPLLIFKHSTHCPTSAGAFEELSNWVEDAEQSALNCVLVLVVENRVVSEAISAKLSLKHESPQTILVENGKVVWHASHWRITYSTLDEHLGHHCEK
ncbi:bacillithiol system redox-active protein YtxJ [Paenibacillus spongiae]|uniref:Bacillithiol system redox-active protein YtxJ n=1 Tax=Paenibacillus spongiae TaxID=2909671 RepID=A0ABY5S1W9_9BACL|nr:bacillithiol system redox-active protein YtxJ [Paenibacillus spongiae]UVI27871.1 bacillithiol system redox-active protein YtxJ [Paenibacillus spongiae]